MERCLCSFTRSLENYRKETATESHLHTFFAGLALVHVSAQFSFDYAWVETHYLDVGNSIFLKHGIEVSCEINVGKFALLVSYPRYVAFFMLQVIEKDFAIFVSQAGYVNDSSLLAGFDLVQE